MYGTRCSEVVFKGLIDSQLSALNAFDTEDKLLRSCQTAVDNLDSHISHAYLHSPRCLESERRNTLITTIPGVDIHFQDVLSTVLEYINNRNGMLLECWV